MITMLLMFIIPRLSQVFAASLTLMVVGVFVGAIGHTILGVDAGWVMLAKLATWLEPWAVMYVEYFIQITGAEVPMKSVWGLLLLPDIIFGIALASLAYGIFSMAAVAHVGMSWLVGLV